MSATKVGVLADELQLRHTAADGRIEAAQAGVPAGSAVALGETVARWRVDTSCLFGRLADHGQALGFAAAGYLSTERDNATGLHSVADEASSIERGL